MTASPINGPMSESLMGILESLPNPGIAGDACPRRTKVELDLMLLAIEAIESSSSEQILELAKELNLDEVIDQSDASCPHPSQLVCQRGQSP
jgi:hypothetical protein